MARSIFADEVSEMRRLRQGTTIAFALATGAWAFLGLAAPASAGGPGVALGPACGCQRDRAELDDRYRAIESAPDVSRAREMALADSDGARDALRRARWFAPGSESLAAASERLDDYTARVAGAETPSAVAREFAQLVDLPTGAQDPLSVDVGADDDGGCEYSTGEIIAIVLGFILGIIPGIILLILLC